MQRLRRGLDSMFDQAALLQRLQALPFSKEEYWGGGRRCHGAAWVSADELERQGFAVTRCDDGSRKISYSENIEIFENWIDGKVTFISGVPVVCADGLLQMKKKLGRDKDLADIVLLERARKQVQ